VVNNLSILAITQVEFGQLYTGSSSVWGMLMAEEDQRTTSAHVQVMAVIAAFDAYVVPRRKVLQS